MENRGFTLIEVLVAMTVLCVAALGGVQLVAMATQMMAGARTHALSAHLASARLEQLRGLRLAFDNAGQRVTDLSTALTADPPGPGGSGLADSGPATLNANVAGFVDFLDGTGRWAGTGAAAPPGAAFVRRWSIERTDVNGDLLVIQVVVRPLAGGAANAVRRVNGEVRYATLRARVRS